jgi:signal transduction histidine kinase
VEEQGGGPTAGDLRAELGALAAEAGRTSGTALRLALGSAVTARLSPAQARELAHVVREAVSNAVRHGGARGVRVRLAAGAGGARLTVRDDGAGFDPSTAPPGHGLRNMAARAAGRGGSLAVASAPGRGTTIRLRFPLG